MRGKITLFVKKLSKIMQIKIEIRIVTITDSMLGSCRKSFKINARKKRFKSFPTISFGRLCDFETKPVYFDVLATSHQIFELMRFDFLIIIFNYYKIIILKTINLYRYVGF